MIIESFKVNLYICQKLATDSCSFSVKEQRADLKHVPEDCDREQEPRILARKR